MQSLSDCFNIQLDVYSGNDRLIFKPHGGIEPCFIVRMYSDQDKELNFDSIISISLFRPLNNDTLLKNDLRLFVRMSTWNVRGATDSIKRDMIDFELNQRGIWVCGIQESHLWSHSTMTANYHWVLGPQYQRRASRGTGFLVHRNFQPEMLDIKFPHPNIAVLMFKFPDMKYPFYFINMHKCNEGDVSSGIEIGKTRLKC